MVGFIIIQDAAEELRDLLGRPLESNGYRTHYQSIGEFTMRQLPNEKELLELLEMAKMFEQQMKEQCEIAKKMYEKNDKRIREIKEAKATC